MSDPTQEELAHQLGLDRPEGYAHEGPRPAIDWMAEPWLILDLETTGVPAEDHWPVEVGLVVFMDGEEVSATSQRIRPPIPIPEGASAIHGICDANVTDAPTIEQAAPGIVAAMMEHRVIVAYNGYRYDWPMLKARCPGFYEACKGRIFLDPLVLIGFEDVGRYWKNANRANPERGRHTLENAAAASGLEFDPGELHGAVADCRLTGGILWRWRERLPTDGREAQRALVMEARAQEARRREYKSRQ